MIPTRFALSEHAVAVMLAASGLLFAAGMVLQSIARAACPSSSVAGAR